MKVGILTHYNVASHGALLQLYALEKTIENNFNSDVVVLTYEKNFDFADADLAKKFRMGISSIPYYLRQYLFDTSISNLLFQAKKQRDLKAFRSRTFHFAPYAFANVDVAVVGADEVFSLQYGLNPMMYGHGVDANEMVAYAPSFGQTDIARIDQFHERTLISSGLKQFASLSVRDEHSQRVVRELTGTTPCIVCDPALLYDFELELSGLLPPMDKPYLLIYGYTSNMNDHDTIDAIKTFAKRNNMVTVSLEGYHGWCDKNVVTDPIGMLAWFAFADGVFTDTFHGTISSIITETPVAIQQRSSNTAKMSYLISQLGLEDRVGLDAGKALEAFSHEEDFSRIKDCVFRLRAGGLEYLQNALGR